MTAIGDFEQRRVALATGVSLDTLDIGPRDGPALIFLHGFPESHRSWRHQIVHLSKRFRCIAPDQRGYRGSSKPPEVEAYTADKLISDIFALADALEVEKFTIVGHDWGGAIAWGVALNGQPSATHAANTAWVGRVKRAVIANAPHPFLFQRLLLTNSEQRAASQYIRAFRDRKNDALIREKGLTGLLSQAVNWNRSSALEPEESARLLADWQDRDACFAMINWYRAAALEVPPMDAPIGEEAALSDFASSDFPKITIPVLVIWALDDLALPACNLDGLEELVPNARIVQVPGCGHFVPWEVPLKVNAAMDEFLEDTAS